MRFAVILKTSILNLILLTACNLNWYGDIDLGGDFYYLIDPDFNSINVSVNPMKPYVSSNYIIKNVEWIGFNKKIILAISDSSHVRTYWIIDKTKKKEHIGFDKNSNMILSNVNKIDSIEFNEILRMSGVEMKSKNYYRKKLNYE